MGTRAACRDLAGVQNGGVGRSSEACGTQQQWAAKFCSERRSADAANLCIETECNVCRYDRGYSHMSSSAYRFLAFSTLPACPRTGPLSSPFSAESWHIPQRPPTPSSPSPPGSPPMSSNTDPSAFCQHCTGSKSAASDVAAPPLDRLLPSKIWPATPPPLQHGRLGGALQAGRLGGALHKWRSDSIRTALPLRCDTSNTTSSDSPP